MKRLHPTLWFLISWLLAGATFWIVEGRTVAWDIYTNGEYLYSEEFALRGKILVSCFVGILVAGALFGAWSAFQWIQGKEPIQSATDQRPCSHLNRPCHRIHRLGCSALHA